MGRAHRNHRWPPARLATLMTLSTLAPLCAAGAADEIRFAADVAPILAERCAICHVTGAEPGHMALYAEVSYQYLVGVPSEQSKLKRVEPGDPDHSYLIHKLDGTQVKVGGFGQQMPASNPPLEDELQAKIRRWIAAGALNN